MLGRMLAARLCLCLLISLSPAPGAPPAPSAAGEAAYDDLLRRAGEALHGGDAAAALPLLDQALRLDPEGGGGFLLLGQAYRKMGLSAEASAALRRAVDLLGETTLAGLDALSELAAALADEERNDEAIESLRRVLSLSPRRLGAHRDLGMIYLALGRLEAAAGEFRQEIALHARASGDVDSRGPGAPRHPALASSYEGLGIASYRLGDEDTAIEALGKASATVEARYHLGLALSRRGRNEEAAEALRDALRREPDHRGALQNLARVAGSLGLEEERLRSLRRFQDLYREEERRRAVRIKVKDLREQVERQVQAADLRGAVASMERAVALAPDDADALLDLGRLHARAGDQRRARDAFQRVVQLQPLNAEAHHQLGRAQAEQGDVSGAIVSMEEAARLDPAATSFRAALAQAYMRAGRADDAVRELRLAKRLDPKEPDNSFNLGLGLAQAGALREAAAELEEAVKLGYRDALIHQVMAQLYRSLGDMERSAREQALFERLSGAKP